MINYARISTSSIYIGANDYVLPSPLPFPDCLGRAEMITCPRSSGNKLEYTVLIPVYMYRV